MNPDLSPTLSAAKRTRRKEARPGELLDAALTLFVDKGYAATRVEEVASRAGVSKGTLFRYFPSKEALFKAVVRENASRHLEEAFREVAAFTGSSADLLREFIWRWWTQYGGTPAAGLTKLIMSEATNFPDLAEYYMNEVVRPSHELLRRVVLRGIEGGEFRPVTPEHAVHLIVAPLVQMVTWRYSLAPCCPVADIPDSQALLALHTDMVLRGLRADAA